jgi:HPt (histidine-containing phosphotransfer) domain-containing protein
MTSQAIVFLVATALLLFGALLLRLRGREARGPEAVVVPAPAPPPVKPRPDPGAEVMEHLRKLESRASAGLAAHVLPIFLQDTAVRLAALRDGVARQDGDTVHRVAHTLHGSAATVGASSFVRGCVDIIREIRTGSFDQCEPIITALEHDLELIRRSAAFERGRD